ncbi:MAG TPA: DUF2339 domain-containing protein [Casimicrobiaceae bacterium]|jgi:uncharacterized membrane protein
MTWLGLLIGGVIGSSWGFRSMLLGALIGALIGTYLRRSAARPMVAPRATPLPDMNAVRAPQPPAVSDAAATADVAAGAPLAPAGVPPGPIADGASSPPLVPVRKGGAGAAFASRAASAAAGTATPAARAPAAGAQWHPLWAWFTGGNALTRIGVVILFFGVAFLLRYLAEIVTIPIEWRLIGVGVVGVLLIAVGIRLARARPGYGLSLQGAGEGVLYLTTFAAFRLYHVLPPIAGLLLLAAIAALTVALAIRADSQPLAGLAVAGGFLAPMLTGVSGEPALLFGFFAILNAAIFALAWVRSWRALNLLGFVFTFVLGSVWAYRYYQPPYFATVEPFLILFFVFYVAIAILYAHRGRFEARAPVDGLLVIGVPLVGFGLQAALVHDVEYGAAWSAVALAIVYGLLFLLLRKRDEAGLALLARAFLALAAIFATIAVPLAFDYRITAALWAVAAAGAFWLGVRQNTPLLRGFALLVEFGAGAVFLWSHAARTGDPLFANAFFVGAILVGLSGLVTAAVADRAAERLPASERGFIPLLLLWGAAWWLAGGAFELKRHLDLVDTPQAVLAWVAASVAAALLLRQVLRWPRLASIGIALLPTMALVAWHDFQIARTTLENFGWLVWPLAWAVQWSALYTTDTQPGAGAGNASTPVVAPNLLYGAHAVSAIALTAQIAWEASEWVDRIAPPATVWLACAAVAPLLAYLLLVHSFTRTARWPFTLHREAYAIGAGAPIAVLVAVWFAIATVVSPGTASPLAYVPIFNPLELTLVLALVALFVWAARFSGLREATRYAWLGVGLFGLLNGAALRTAHHWGEIPWQLTALLGSKLLQAGLTLAWTATAVVLMFFATRRALRPLWMIGAGLLALAIGKLFLIDLAALSGLPRVVAFLGVGSLLLLIGYLSPLPPAARDPAARDDAA